MKRLKDLIIVYGAIFGAIIMVFLIMVWLRITRQEIEIVSEDD